MVWRQNEKKNLTVDACSPQSHQRDFLCQQDMNHEDIFRFIYQSHKKLLPNKKAHHPYRLCKPSTYHCDSGMLRPITVNALPAMCRVHRTKRLPSTNFLHQHETPLHAPDIPNLNLIKLMYKFIRDNLILIKILIECEL